jgi:galactitol-specific phosphotransferase system IIC component
MTTLEKIFNPLIGIGLTVVIIFIIVYLAFWISNKLSDDD